MLKNNNNKQKSWELGWVHVLCVCCLLSRTVKLKFYTLGGQLQQTHLCVTDFFPRRKKKEKKKLAWGWRKVSSQSLDVFLLGILFKSIRFSGFWGSCAVLEKTLPEWIIYKAAGNCKLWWTNLFDVLISWGAVSVPPSATFCRDSGLSLAMAAQSPQKVAQLPNKGQDGKEVSSQDAPLSPLVPPAARLLKRV